MTLTGTSAGWGVRWYETVVTPLSHSFSCMLVTVNHGPSQQSFKEKYKPWKWGSAPRYSTHLIQRPYYQQGNQSSLNSHQPLDDSSGIQVTFWVTVAHQLVWCEITHLTHNHVMDHNPVLLLVCSWVSSFLGLVPSWRHLMGQCLLGRLHWGDAEWGDHLWRWCLMGWWSDFWVGTICIPPPKKKKKKKKKKEKSVSTLWFIITLDVKHIKKYKVELNISPPPPFSLSSPKSTFTL